MKSGAATPEKSLDPDGRLFEESPEPLWLVSLPETRLINVNHAATERFGYTREQFLSMTLADFHTQADVEKLRQAALHHDEKSPDLRAWKTRSVWGDIIETDMSARFLDIAGAPCALLCPLDMMERKSLEERLRQAGKMEAIGMLAGGIAHDFNNLLTIISGYSQLLLNSVPDTERASIDQILKASQRAAELTGQLLAFSRRREMQPQPLDVNRIVSGMSTMLRRLIGEHIELNLSLAENAGYVYADPGQLDQVIMNLSVNASDAMKAGGKLVIETAEVDLSAEPQARTLGVKAGHYITICVSDTGVGMDARTKARVFDPFFTTKETGRGTGLGLSTVYSIVKQAGGSIELYSELDRGTSVKVYLPRVVDGASEEPPEFQHSEAPGGLETILVVEDEDAVRRLVRATLERRGYRVLVASGGPEAIQAGKNAEKIDLLIADLVMPQMSGVEVAHRLRENRPSMRVLFMSGYTDRSQQRTSALPHDSEFLQKPFTPAVLAARVREVLDQYSGKSERASGSES